MRASFIFSEVFTGLRRNITMTIAMILTTAISLGLFGGGLLVVQMAGKTQQIFLDRVEVQIFLTDDISATDADCAQETCATLRSDLEKRTSIIARAQQIIGQGQSVRAVAPQILSMNPIDSQSMMTSRLSTLLSTMGVDLSKIQVNQFSSSMVSSLVMRSEADFAFSSVTTDELMNIFIGMIQRERFRVESVNIERNAETNTLQGQFHAIHFSQVTNAEEE